MSKVTLLLCVFLTLCLSINLKAQDTAKKKSISELKDKKNPLTFARVNFYKKTALIFNEYLNIIFLNNLRGKYLI